jgi:hypothetical protein
MSQQKSTFSNLIPSLLDLRGVLNINFKKLSRISFYVEKFKEKEAKSGLYHSFVFSKLLPKYFDRYSTINPCLKIWSSLMRHNEGPKDIEKMVIMFLWKLKPKRKECALVESKTVKIQILRIENKGM